MDFRGRNNQSTPASPSQPVNRGMGSTTNKVGGSGFSSFGGRQPAKLFQIASIVLLFSATALVVALTFLLVFGGNAAQKAVQKDKYQAVFLNNGQVYFGNIHFLGSKTIDLRNIYYLQTNGSTDANTQQSAPTNVSLVKLGCELHAPYDQMLINNDQVIFWENLQDSGQVVKTIADYKKSKPTSCSQQSQSSTQQAPSATTPAETPATTPTTQTPATNPTTKKP